MTMMVTPNSHLRQKQGAQGEEKEEAGGLENLAEGME